MVLIIIAEESKTVLVECGIFCRPVNFTCHGNDLNSLKDAIVGSFRGLRKKHIALLQIKSEVYSGHFVDILDPGMRIEDSSFIRVIPYNKVNE